MSSVLALRSEEDALRLSTDHIDVVVNARSSQEVAFEVMAPETLAQGVCLVAAKRLRPRHEYPLAAPRRFPDVPI